MLILLPFVVKCKEKFPASGKMTLDMYIQV